VAIGGRFVLRIFLAAMADPAQSPFMDWAEDAIVLHIRPHGETSAVAELFARSQGRHLGLVRGGRAKKLRAALQPGNLVAARWRARLADHLGFLVIELAEPFAARALDDRLALAGIATLTGLARLLPERDPHPLLYDLGVLMLRHLSEPELWPQLLARWELQLLSELGFGLDLETCAATGTTDELIYVSPKSGRAVSAEAGEPYKGKLLPLPAFLKSRTSADAFPGDIVEALNLTGFFLDEHVLRPRNLRFPEGRAQLLEVLRRQSQ
jgi:DNA repair protein RecO (recombination protein O)